MTDLDAVVLRDPIPQCDHRNREEALQYAHEHESHPSRVVAVFETGALCYLLPAGATLGDLAECMSDLDQQSGRAPVAIYINFDMPPDKPPSVRPWTWSRSPSWRSQADKPPTLKWNPIGGGTV